MDILREYWVVVERAAIETTCVTVWAADPEVAHRDALSLVKMDVFPREDWHVVTRHSSRVVEVTGPGMKGRDDDTSNVAAVSGT